MRLAAAVCLVVAAGCTDASSSPPATVSCQAAVIALCKAACMCAAADAAQVCGLAVVADGAGGDGLTWASATACELAFAPVCADGSATSGFNATACTYSITIAACVSTVNGGRALAIPAACNVGPQDGGVDGAR